MTQYNLKKFISQFENLNDLTNSETSKIPSNPKQNVDMGKKNEDLAGKSVPASKVPSNKSFNKDSKKKNDDLDGKAEAESKVPSNKKFNTGAQKINKDISNKGMLEGVMKPTSVDVGSQNYLNGARSRARSFVPQMDIRDVYEKLYMEAAAEDKPVFSLDLSSLIMDKMNCKFNINRHNKILTAELMYPNANGKLSIRVEADGMGTVDEITLDSDEYKVLGDYIKGLADKVIETSGAKSPFDGSMFGDLDEFVGSGYNDEEMANIGSVAPDNEHVQGNIFNSFKGTRMDSVNIQSFKSLMEAEDDEEAPDAGGEDLGAGDVNATDGGEEIDVADLGGDEGGEDLDVGGGAFDDIFGGGDSLGDMPSDSFDVNVSGGGAGEPDIAAGTSQDEEEPVSLFREKEDGFDNAALVGMEKLLASEASKATKRGSGIELTPHESYAGTRGIKGKFTNRELIDEFLKVYPELDEIEIPTALLNDIEDKLAQQDGESFDEYLKGILPEIRGEEQEVDFNALNNDMFEEFEPMGGEEESGPAEQMSFDEFDFGGDEDGLPEDEAPVGDEEESDLVDIFDTDLDMFNDIEPDEDETE